MRKLTLIVILLLVGTALLCRAEFLDYTSKMVNFAVSVTTHTNTEVRPVNGNRRDIPALYNFGSDMVWIGYDVNMSTTTAYPLQSGSSLPNSLEYYTGSIYGISSSTTPVEIRGIELEYQ